MANAADFKEDIDLTIEPWATVASRCWNEPSPYRMGAEAEMQGIADNPYTKPLPRALFEEGRELARKVMQRAQAQQKGPAS